MFHVPEQYRRADVPQNRACIGHHAGAFLLPATIPGRTLHVIASDGLGWEHVSVHAWNGRKSYTPTWAEMCAVKAVFWDPEDVVMQLHPAQSESVNMHSNVLHLWAPSPDSGQTIPVPESFLVGLKGIGPLNTVS